MFINNPQHAESLQIYESPANGHCLFYSVITSWNSQYPNEPPLDIHKLKCIFFIESNNNLNIYSAFLEDPSPYSYSKAIKKYIIDKCYNQSFFDFEIFSHLPQYKLSSAISQL